MKVVILAGGKGTRIGEESQFRPKPLVEIGGRPILWHIMKWYSRFGFHEFVLCCGYKGHMIKQYFVDYYSRYSFPIPNVYIVHLCIISADRSIFCIPKHCKLLFKSLRNCFLNSSLNEFNLKQTAIHHCADLLLPVRFL